jgi:hypothetical protein
LKLIGYLLLTIEVVNRLSGNYLDAGSGSAWATLIRIGECLSVGGSLTALAGYVFFIIGPKKHGKMGLAIAVTAVAGLDLLLSLIFKLPFVFGSMGPVVEQVGPFGGVLVLRMDFGSWFMLLICQLLFVTELILVPVYLRLVARDFRKNALGRNGLYTIYLTGAYGGLRLLVWILYYITMAAIIAMFAIDFRTRFDMRPPEPPRGLIWITLITLWLGSFAYLGQTIWYTIFLWKARDMVQPNERR